MPSVRLWRSSGFAHDEGIELRVGITTGEALVALDARPEAGETLATGDVVNTAARLQAGAPVNGILVSEKTFEATKAAIEYAEVSAIEAKGKAAPVAVWEATAAHAAVGADRRHGSPFVGRTRELELLRGALERTREEGQPELVTLVGVPGIGKSRLLHELAGTSAADSLWLRGRCLPYGDGVTFWALGEIVKTYVGVQETDEPESVESQLGAAVPEEWVRTHLRPLVGLGVEHAEGDQRQEAFAAWRRFIEGIAAARPTTIVFEDLHWADDAFLDFVDELVEWTSGVPLLVVCTARPELLEQRPAWGGGKPNALTVSLSPLSDDDTARLVSSVVGRPLMDSEVQEALLARAGGNPLYAEQYAGLLEEQPEGDLSLPETVQGLIAARLDLLEPDQKSALQDASVLGGTFWVGALMAISGMDRRVAEVALHALERKGFVRREREMSSAGDGAYTFEHLLVRDVAYGQIPRAPRSEKHRLTAEWIEGLVRSEERAEMLAHHYGAALELARAARVDVAQLEEPARHAFAAAGDRAVALNGYDVAIRLYEQALALWGDDDLERARLLLRRAEAVFFGQDSTRSDLLDEARDALLARGDVESAAVAEILGARVASSDQAWSDAWARGRSAADRVSNAPPSAAKVYVVANYARLLSVTERAEEALVTGREALVMADALDLGVLRAHALSTIGIARVALDDFGGLADLEQGRVLLGDDAPGDERFRAFNNLVWTYNSAGQCEIADDTLAELTAHVARLGIRAHDLYVLAMRTYFAHARGRWNEAERLADEYIARSDGAQTNTVVRVVRARIAMARGDLETASIEAEAAWQELARSNSEHVVELGFVLYIRARVALESGDRFAARDILSEAVAPIAGSVAAEDELLVELAWLVVELDVADSAFGDAVGERRRPWNEVALAIVAGELERAADRLGEFGNVPLEAFARLRTAERLVAEGRRGEADAQLGMALAFYRSVGATRYVREGEALLAATA